MKLFVFESTSKHKNLSQGTSPLITCHRPTLRSAPVKSPQKLESAAKE